MATISAISTNHTKILTGLKDSRLCNKLAESKAKKWTNMSQVLQDVAEMAVNFKRSRGYSLPTFEVQYISSNKSSSSFRPHRQSTKIHKLQLIQKSQNVGIAKVTITKRTVQQPLNKAPHKTIVNKGQAV